MEAFQAQPEEARRFIERAAGGFFDVLNLNSDAVFLELVEQFWFDPSPTAPGRLLFGCV